MLCILKNKFTQPVNSINKVCLNFIYVLCLLTIVLTNCAAVKRRSVHHKRYIIHVPLKIRSHHHTHTVYTHSMTNDHNSNNENARKNQQQSTMLVSYSMKPINQNLKQQEQQQQQQHLKQRPSQQFLYKENLNHHPYEMWRDCLDMQQMHLKNQRKKRFPPYNGRSINDWRYYQQQLYSRNAQHDHTTTAALGAASAEEYIEEDEEDRAHEFNDEGDNTDGDDDDDDDDDDEIL